MEPHTAQAALRGFQPFAADPSKQARYTAYLTAQSMPSHEDGWVPLGKLPGQSVEQLNKEMADYAKSAQIFKPMSGAMAGRFTSAAVVEDTSKPLEGLHMPSVESANARVIEEAQRKEKEAEAEKDEETPKMHAVRMGMFGRLTREVKPWMPAKLLCKRFGVKDPNPEPPAAATSSAGAFTPASGDSADVPMPDILLLTGTESFRATSNAGLSGGQGGGPRKKDLSNVGLGEDDDQGKDTLTYQRPAKDIFKAIFASDDESDGDEEDEGEKMDVDVVEKPMPTPAHLQAGPSTSTSTTTLTPYESRTGNSSSSQMVDTGSFKPTFIPRDGAKPDRASKDKKEKKKKKAGRTIVSFDLGEDGEESLSLSIPQPKHSKSKSSKDKDKDKDRPKKKKRKEDQEEDIWVEKPLPVVKVVGAAPGTDAMDVDTDTISSDRGRKKAIDFW